MQSRKKREKKEMEEKVKRYLKNNTKYREHDLSNIRIRHYFNISYTKQHEKILSKKSRGRENFSLSLR